MAIDVATPGVKLPKKGGGFIPGGETTPRLPFFGSMLNAEIFPEPWFSTYRKGPAGLAAAAMGVVPVLKMLDGVGDGMGLVLAGTVSWPLPRFMESRVTL